MKKLRWLFEFFFLLFFTFPIAILPMKVSLKTGEIFGLLLFYLWGSRRRIAEENIKQSLLSGIIKSKDTPERIASKSFMNLGRYFAELIKIYYGFGKVILDSVKISGFENYQKALSKNKGVIFLTGHCGNWELAAISASYKIDRCSVVARRQNNPFINRLLEMIRAKYGNNVIYKKGAFKGILSELSKQGNIGILMDQSVLMEEGYIIDFLGRGAWTTKVPALIARKTGAPVLPIFIHRNDDNHILEIFHEAELSNKVDNKDALIEDTKKFSAFIEDYVKQHPSEWLWMHRRWKRVKNNGYD